MIFRHNADLSHCTVLFCEKITKRELLCDGGGGGGGLKKFKLLGALKRGSDFSKGECHIE